MKLAYHLKRTNRMSAQLDYQGQDRMLNMQLIGPRQMGIKGDRGQQNQLEENLSQKR